MSLYEGIKDVAKVVQQADNIELYRQLLDLSSLALEMQSEINELKEEIASLKKKRDITENIIRHEEPVVTLLNADKNLYYCSHCWDSDSILIQLNCHSNGTFICQHCGAKGNYDNQKKKQSDAKQLEAFSQIGMRKY